MEGPVILHVRRDGLHELADWPDAWPSDGFIWIATTRETLQAQFPALQTRLMHELHGPLMDLHVSDLLNEQLPSHFEATRVYDLMVLRRLAAARTPDGTWDWAEAIDTRAVGFAVYDRLLLSVHPQNCPVLSYFLERLPLLVQVGESRAGVRLPLSPDELMLRMLNHMVDSYLELRRQLTRRIGDLQQALLDTHRPFQDWPQLLTARDALVRLEELCEDQQAAVQEWLDAQLELQSGTEPNLEAETHRVRARDVLEHIERVLSHIRRLMASTESAVQMHYAALGHRTNGIMKVLTALTAVFLPLNLITGIFGMNFDALPLIHNQHGAWVALGLMGLLGIGLGVWFRRKRYLGSRS
ncbi:magnesium transporter CorA family protein [Inhella gelatinilytica]|uniref:Magnesium transporter CorA family protein n=1 Tax=Inhella gelatinilytica TaxID=2795030 RepID=A0A931IZD5_9BURK|nr:magnesium transporter CorA family protein [Inhella gelatinilytica]MBH9553904.1 magnesium transporter CorA family protein [Inhella gelatinilytica]